MIKNKDGSYNKFSILILSLIGLIGIGIIGSTLLENSITIDSTIIAYIGLIISGGLTIYFGKKVFLKPKPVQSYQVQPQPVKPVLEFTVEDDDGPEERKYILNTKRSSGFGLSGITTMVISLVIGGVMLMIGTVVINSMMQALPELPSNNPEMSSSVTQITGTVSSAFNIAALGLIVFAAIGLIMTMTRIFHDPYD